MIAMQEPVVLVHPDDINLADAKRLAADYNTTVEASPNVPRGKALLCDRAATRLPETYPRLGGTR